MKLVKLTTILVVLALLVSFCASMKKAGKGETGTISGILREANCPLSEVQEKKLKEFKLGGGPETFRTINEVFDEKQTEALKEILGTFPGFQGGPESPRMLFFVIIFENEGCPFTGAQIKQIKELPEGREAFEKMREIYSEEQSELVQEMFNR